MALWSGADYVNRISVFRCNGFRWRHFVIAAVLVLAGRWKWAAAPIVLLSCKAVIPPHRFGVYVKPNETHAAEAVHQRHHINATRAAYGLDTRLKEVPVSGAAGSATSIRSSNKPLLDNVRLWDWRAFHDTVTQLQALRQYYVFADTDVDRYMIDGKLRQVMLAPRELDIRQLADARANWINRPFHLHARLRAGDGGSEPHHRERPARS